MKNRFLKFFSVSILLAAAPLAAEQDEISRKAKKRYDYIIVGGGSAGCILARKLTDDLSTSVLLLEAGGDYTTDPITLDPNWLNHANELLADPRFSITYPLTFGPLEYSIYSEGHELGGGAAHNFLLNVRGTPEIYNLWASTTGNSNWSYNGNVLPLMKSLEKFANNGSTPFDPANDGASGPIGRTQSPALNPVSGDYISCLSSITNAPFVADYNNPTYGNIGISAAQQFITADGSRRSFSAYEFLNPVIDSNGHGLCGRKLTVITNANALDIRINSNKRATSVHYTRRNSERPEVEYEVTKASLTKNTGKLILAAGSIQTPKILLQSGVGPAADLMEVGISVVLDSPHVGQNLQCQYGASAILTGDSTVPFGAMGFLDGYPYMPNDGVRRLQTLGVPFGGPVFQVLPFVTNPASRGSVKLTTSNPFLLPRVDIQLFTDGSVNTPGTDAYLQVSFYKIMQQVAACMGGAVIYPTPADYLSDEDLLQAAENNMVIQSHVVGTARMGTSIFDGVVDGNLKVFGLDNVYIGDNSVQPETTNGNTCYPAYVIALVLCQVLGVPTPPIL